MVDLAGSNPFATEARNEPRPVVSQLEVFFDEVNALSLLARRSVRFEDSKRPLTASEQSVLKLLQRAGPQTVPQIARARSTSRQNIQILVNWLTDQGCIEIRKNPAHKRSALLCLTPQGGELLSAAKRQQTELRAKVEPSVAPDQLGAAIQILRRIREVLEELEPVRTSSRPVSQGQAQLRAGSAVVSLSEETPGEQSALPVNLL